MTMEQFETARRRAASLYLLRANTDRCKAGATKRERDNARERQDLTANLLTEWDTTGFWTPANVLAYRMIYQTCEDVSAVSAF